MTLAQRHYDRFPAPLRDRGQHYQADGRVRLLERSPEKVVAEVQCTRPHRVVFEPSGPDLGARCDCPYFRQRGVCKHLWAAILACDAEPPAVLEVLRAGDFDDGELVSDVMISAAEPSRAAISNAALSNAVQSDAVPSDALRAVVPRSDAVRSGAGASSLGGIGAERATASSSGHDPGTAEATRERAPPGLVYVLRRAARKGPSVDLYRQLPGGRLVSIRLGRADVRHLVEASDRELLALVFGIPIEGDGTPDGFDPQSVPYRVECSSFPLAGSNCRLWVERLCQTGRFLEQYEPGRVRVLSWEGSEPWRLGVTVAERPGAGMWLEGFLVRGDERRALHAGSGLLGDGVAIQDGRAAGLEAPGEWLLRLAGGPVRIEDPDVEATIVRLLEAPEHARPVVELPAGWRWEGAPAPPRPVLRLRLWEGGRLRRETIPARLLFEYSGRRVALGDVQEDLVSVATRTVQRRDRALEAEARRDLLALGVEVLAEAADGNEFTLAVDRFPEVANALLADGWVVESRDHRYRGQGKLSLSVTSGVDWFDLQGTLTVDGQEVPLTELLAAARRGEAVVRLEDGTAGLLPPRWLRKVRLLASLGKRRGQRVRFARTQGWLLDALLANQPEVDADAVFQRLCEERAAFTGIESEPEPHGFQGQLRGYQREALGWFRFLRRFGLGGCLADDMGLGKTVQVLALLAQQAHEGAPGPTLVVAPRSVVFNWIDEARRFTPELRIVDYSGTQREALRDEFARAQIVVTSYGVLRQDVQLLRAQRFYYVVLDEAQTIKNPGSKTARSARALSCEHRLALTGTPIENHLHDLWSIFEYLNPGMLGSSTMFQRVLSGAAAGAGSASQVSASQVSASQVSASQVSASQVSAAVDAGADAGTADGRAEDPDEASDREELARALRPFLLRRTKEQVARDLPAKTEQTLFCDLAPRQAELYHELLLHYRATLLPELERDGLENQRMHVLEALLRLRQVACHPGLVDQEYSALPGAKLDLLLEQLHEVLEEGHKALVFSQFTSFLALVRQRLVQAGIDHEYLDGKTRHRQVPVARFQDDPRCGVFLISLKAGGQGLNLTAADYVYILDPWWNPAVEAQAIDRAHRIGQLRNVFAYRIISRGTIEEKILALQDHKRQLAESIIRADNTSLRDLTPADVALLLS